MTSLRTKPDTGTAPVAICELCGHPMPAGEEMFRFHGYSCECPKPAQFLTAEDGEFNGNVPDEVEASRPPIAATDGREVDWVDVTGWGVFKGHAIPVEVARYIAEKINLYAQHRVAAPVLLAALKSARTVIQEDRDAMFDSVTVAGIASTMDDVDRPHIERLDAALAEINRAIAKAEGR